MALLLSILFICCILAYTIGTPIETEKADIVNQVEQNNNDLIPDASTYYSSRHTDWSTNNYPYEDSRTGYGLLDNNYAYSPINNYNYYDNGQLGSSNGYNGFNTHYNYVGNGGYGGYGGNEGLHSYLGYNHPNYQGVYHLGYGYYNKRQGHGNIYNSGITPSLVTGYRGYSK